MYYSVTGLSESLLEYFRVHAFLHIVWKGKMYDKMTIQKGPETQWLWNFLITVSAEHIVSNLILDSINHSALVIKGASVGNVSCLVS